MDALERYASVRPAGQTAAVTWFRLGDRDLATHLYRTARRREGATLTEITAEIAARLERRRARAADDRRPGAQRASILADGSDLPFQDYFVRLRSRRRGQRRAVRPRRRPARPLPRRGDRRRRDRRRSRRPTRSCRSSRSAPCPGVDEALARRRDSVVAVSPIVGGRALKGPADRLLRELGHEPTVARRRPALRADRLTPW